MPKLDEIAKLATKKIGPLPAWGWGAAGVGGVMLGRAVRSRFAGPETATSSARSYVPAGPVGVPLADLSAGLGPVASPPVPEAPELVNGKPPNQPTGPTTNNEWKRLALRMAVEGGSSSVAATEAVDRYLAGLELTPSQVTIMEYVLGTIGVPPEGAPILRIQQPKADPVADGQPSQTSKPSGSSSSSVDHNLPPELAALGVAQLAAAVRATGHNYGSRLDVSDLAAALRARGHDYGSRVDVSDALVLLGRSPTTTTTTETVADQSPAPTPTRSPATVAHNLPPELAALGIDQLAAAVRATGHDFGSRLDVSDLAAALRARGHDYGSRVDASDARRLLS